MAGTPRRRASAAPRISPGDLEAALRRGDPAPVYVLAGGEAVLRDRALTALRKRQISPEFELFNLRTLVPAGLDGEQLVQELRVLPMGGGGRLVVIQAAEKLLKEQLAALKDYASAPAPRTCLVLVAVEIKEGLKKAFAGAVTVECGSPWEDRIPALLLEESRELGVRLDPSAAAALVERFGRDLSRAVGELRKMAVAAGEGGAITGETVERLAGGRPAGDVYRVASALARGDTPGAVRAARLYMEGQERGEPRILFELGLHLRRLLAARGNVAGGMPVREAARAAGVFWKDVDAFAETLSRWPEARIREAYRGLISADRMVKRGAPGLPAIEAWLWGLQRGRPGAGPGRAP